MLVQDQAVRTGVAPAGDPRPPDELAAAWDETDRTHNARMTQVLAEHGWPGWRLVGSDGAFAAWVLVQHADLDLPLQERGLELMSSAVAAGDADPSDHAYLVDRVRVAKGEPQVYGTQWGSDAAGEPGAADPDRGRVDGRRAAGVGGAGHARRLPRGARPGAVTGGSDRVAEVGQRLAQQHAVAALHLGLHQRVERLVGGEPGEVERVVLRGAVAGHRHDERQRHGVLARVVERGHARASGSTRRR